MFTANHPTNITDSRVFDSSMILILRGGSLMSIGIIRESLSHAIFVGLMLVGRLGVECIVNTPNPPIRILPTNICHAMSQYCLFSKFPDWVY